MTNSANVIAIGVREMEQGDDLNTWGDPNLMDNQTVIVRMIHDWNTVTLTGDKTVSETNYSTSNETEYQGILLTGSLTSAATYTIPSRKRSQIYKNETGQTVTVKTAAGSGVAIPNGYSCILRCDGTDVKSEPLYVNGALQINGGLSGVATAVAGTDAPNLTQVNALIASGAIPGATGTVKVDASANPAYLGAALTASGDVTLTDNGDSLDIGVTVPSVPTLGLTDGGIQTSSFTAQAGYRYRVLKASDITVTAPASPSDGALILLECIGTGGVLTWGRNSENVKGQAEDGTIPADFEGQKLMSFTTQASRGWF